MNDQTEAWDNCLEYAYLTNIGMRRANNQDAMAAVIAPTKEQWLERGHLFMVADGMGAHAAGELASKMAVDTVPLTYDKRRDLSPDEAINHAIRAANEKIHSRGEANPEFKGMGTTASILLLLPQGAVVGHVGDSRVYRLRGNRLEQLSFDHSLVWEIRASQQMGGGEVPKMIPKNIITRSLGPHEKVNIDLEGPFPLAVGDTFLVCSDGLSGQVEDDEIGVILGCLAPSEAARVLIDLANLRGGPDNITVCVARVARPQITQVPARLSAVRDNVKGSPQAPLNAYAWALCGVFLLAAGILGMMGRLASAAIALAVAGITAVAVLLGHLFGRSDSASGNLPLLGSGPHTAQVCVANKEFVQRLAATVGRLRDAARGQDWSVDWHRFDKLCQSAVDAEQRNEHPAAAQHYYRAIAHMMGELRGQRQRATSQPAADPDEPRAS